MLELLAIPGDPFGRSRFDPGHFTASAFVLAPEGDALLLILHEKLHRWLQPGGHIDPSDIDVEAAARRELAEEVGLVGLTLVSTGPFDLDVHDIPPRPDGREPGHAHFDVRFLFRSATREVRAGSDACDARWVPLAEVGAWESDASVMRAVRRLRA